MDAYREIKILKELQHPNIVRLIRYVTYRENRDFRTHHEQRTGIVTWMTSMTWISERRLVDLEALGFRAIICEAAEEDSGVSSSSNSNSKQSTSSSSLAVSLVYNYAEHDLSQIIHYQKVRFSASTQHQLSECANHQTKGRFSKKIVKSFTRQVCGIFDNRQSSGTNNTLTFPSTSSPFPPPDIVRTRVLAFKLGHASRSHTISFPSSLSAPLSLSPHLFSLSPPPTSSSLPLLPFPLVLP